MSAEQRALKNNTQFCMPQRTTVRFSMVLKIRFSTKRPARQRRITVLQPGRSGE